VTQYINHQYHLCVSTHVTQHINHTPHSDPENINQHRQGSFATKKSMGTHGIEAV